MITAKYSQKDNSMLLIKASQGDILGDIPGPFLILAPAEEGGRYYDPLMRLVSDGEIEISPYEEPEIVVAVPESVHDYQFAGQAAAEGIITFDDALAWSGNGKIPDVLVDAVNAAVDDPERRMRIMLFLTGSKEYPRNHPLTPLLGPLLGKDDDEALDAFWIAAATR